MIWNFWCICYFQTNIKTQSLLFITTLTLWKLKKILILKKDTFFCSLIKKWRCKDLKHKTQNGRGWQNDSHTRGKWSISCYDAFWHSPVFRFIDVHAAVIPGELLTRFDALVLGRELGRPVHLELLDVVVELLDRDGRMGQHSRGLEIHPSKLHWVGGCNDTCMGHVKARH